MKSLTIQETTQHVGLLL